MRMIVGAVVEKFMHSIVMNMDIIFMSQTIKETRIKHVYQKWTGINGT